MTLFILATLAVGIAMSAVFFAVLFGAALMLGGWLWWQSWRMRAHIRRAARSQSGSGDFIDAEYEVEENYPLLEDARPEKVRGYDATRNPR